MQATKIQQISIFAENRPGAIAEVLSVLAAVGVNARAFTIADTTDFGIIRAIVDKPDVAVTSAKAAGFVVRSDTVLSVRFDDAPGAFYEVHKKLGSIDVKFSYAYPTQDGATGVVGVADAEIDKALAALNG